MKAGGLQAILDSFTAHLRLTPSAGSWGDAGPTNADASAAGCSIRSFDIQLLALTSLTNCVEINSDARQALSDLSLPGPSLSSTGTNALPCKSAEGQTMPICAFLVAYLQLHSFTFKEDLQLDLLDASPLPLSSPTGDSQSSVHSSDDMVPADLGSIQAEINPNASQLNLERPVSNGQDDSVVGSNVVEDLVLAGYTCLLLGCLMRDHSTNYATICGLLPNAGNKVPPD